VVGPPLEHLARQLLVKEPRRARRCVLFIIRRIRVFGWR